ncbi:MAG: polysaccharide deacetylase family protein [Solibacillus sp.]
MNVLKGIFVFAVALLVANSSVVIARADTDARQSYFDKTTAPMIVVMNYHHFGHEGDYPLVENIRISPEEFRRQLETLKTEGYTTISQAELMNYLTGTGQIPQKSLYITIDDGFQSTYTYAYPILKELGMTAMLFPIIADVERGERLGAPMLTWSELREMAESNVLAIGNHTYDLHWRKQDLEGKEAMILNYNKANRLLTVDKRREMIKADLLKAESVLKEQTGIDMAKAISYPFGAYDAVVLEVVEELGYEIGFTTTTGYHTLGADNTNLLEIKRYGVNYRNTTEKLLQTIETSTALAYQKYNERNLRVMSHYNESTHGLYLRISAVRGYPSVAAIQLEVWKMQDGERIYVAPASVAEAMLSEETPYFVHTEKMTEYPVYKKGEHYSLKVMMTNEDDSVDNEWINFTY